MTLLENYRQGSFRGVPFDTFTIKERDIMQLVGPEKNNKK